MKRIGWLVVLLLITCGPQLSFAGWERVSGYSGGGVNGKSSPVEAVAWRFTVESTDTVTNLSMPDSGGCLTSSWVDMGASAPNPLVVTLHNSVGLVVTDISGKSISGDSWLKENDGTTICFSKGFYYSFTATAAIGSSFTLVSELLVNEK